MRLISARVVVAFVCALGASVATACGPSGAVGSPSEDGADDDSGTASPDPNDAQDAGQCGAGDLEGAPSVVAHSVVGIPPTMTGGTLLPGRYVLIAETNYAEEPLDDSHGEASSEVLEIGADTWSVHTLLTNHGAPVAEASGSGSYTVGDASIALHRACPSPDGSNSRYTTNGTTLQIVLSGGWQQHLKLEDGGFVDAGFVTFRTVSSYERR